MASFQKRGKTWQYTVSRMVNGKPKPIRKGGFRTKKEAQIAAAEVEAKLAKGMVADRSPIPFADYFKDWVETYKTDVSDGTKRNYQKTLNVIEEYFMDENIQDINKKMYQKFLNHYGKTVAKTTARQRNAHIRACVKEAIDEGIITKDFTRKVTISGLSSKKPSEKHLNYFESKRLLNELYNRLDHGMVYYVLLLGLTSGLRYGELMGLTRPDFDFKRNTINIDKTWGYTHEAPSGFGPTKNEQSIRKISIDKRTMQTFREMFDRTPTNLYQLVFYNPRSQFSVVDNSVANKALKRILSELNIDPISPHGLRHTHASILLYKRVSIYYVSERLGHANIQTTMKTYAHVLRELRAEDEKSSANIFEQLV